MLLYAPCTVNKDRLSPYDASVAFTPHLEAFAAQSAVFRRHQTDAGQSGIAYASLFTGTGSDRHGIYRHPVRLSDNAYLITEAFADAGFETFFWNDHRAASARLAYGQGVAPGNVVEGPLRAEDPRFLEILERLRADPHYRAFVMTNFTVTHAPYDPGALQEFGRRHPGEVAGLDPARALHFTRLYRAHHHLLALNLPRAVEQLGLSPADLEALVRVVELLYASNVSRLDAMFGAVVAAIDARGLRGGSLIAFTADHGEVLFRETAPFQWSHAMQLAPEVLTVPLLIRGPGLDAGSEYPGVTRSIDVFPTLAGLAGIALPAGAGPQGADLSAALLGRAPAPELVARSHSTVLLHSVFERMVAPETRDIWERMRELFPDDGAERIGVAMREGDRFYKYRWNGHGAWAVELYDLQRDPEERRNLYDPSDPAQRAMAENLLAYKAQLVAAYDGARAGERERRLPEPEETRILLDLGYLH